MLKCFSEKNSKIVIFVGKSIDNSLCYLNVYMVFHWFKNMFSYVLISEHLNGAVCNNKYTLVYKYLFNLCAR